MRTFIAVVAGLMIQVESVRACSCMPPPPPQQAMEHSAAVFSGTVTAIEQQPAGGLRVTLEVHERWKGPQGDSIAVTTAANSAMCGYSFEEGQKYLVYAFGEEDELSTNICTRTKRYDEAREDLSDLGDPAATQPAE